ncbi:hypothetical protein [Catenuloplanes japonicus]|uniref:hypothetical protein n=1 Tax=Catenuloplanes japonicus TaxID=33876 RepID=UPI0005279F1B|nr:hypothetical protein [Catenuloplanes japonicus]
MAEEWTDSRDAKGTYPPSDVDVKDENDLSTWAAEDPPGWRKIKAAVTGGSAIENQDGRDYAAGLVDQNTLVDAASAFQQAYDTFSYLERTIRDGAAAIAGEGRAWKGPAADAFLAKMENLADQFGNQAERIAGGTGMADSASVMNQLMTSARYLGWAKQQLQHLDSAWAALAAADGQPKTESGNIAISKSKYARPMTNQMLSVANTLAGQYVITYSSVSPPGGTGEPSITTPDPAGITTPAPIDFTTPAPIDITTPPPLDITTPPPADITTPPPVDVTPPPVEAPPGSEVPPPVDPPPGSNVPPPGPDAPVTPPGVDGPPGVDDPGAVTPPGVDGPPGVDDPGAVTPPGLDDAPGPGAGGPAAGGLPGFDDTPPPSAGTGTGRNRAAEPPSVGALPDGASGVPGAGDPGGLPGGVGDVPAAPEAANLPAVDTAGVNAPSIAAPPGAAGGPGGGLLPAPGSGGPSSARNPDAPGAAGLVDGDAADFTPIGDDLGLPGVPDGLSPGSGLPTPAVGDLPNGGSIPGVSDLPDGSAIPGVSDLPGGASIPGVSDLPGGASVPGVGDLSGGSGGSGIGGVPAVGDLPGGSGAGGGLGAGISEPGMVSPPSGLGASEGSGLGGGLTPPTGAATPPGAGMPMMPGSPAGGAGGAGGPGLPESPDASGLVTGDDQDWTPIDAGGLDIPDVPGGTSRGGAGLNAPVGSGTGLNAPVESGAGLDTPVVGGAGIGSSAGGGAVAGTPAVTPPGAGMPMMPGSPAGGAGGPGLPEAPDASGLITGDDQDWSPIDTGGQDVPDTTSGASRGGAGLDAPAVAAAGSPMAPMLPGTPGGGAGGAGDRAEAPDASALVTGDDEDWSPIDAGDLGIPDAPPGAGPGGVGLDLRATPGVPAPPPLPAPVPERMPEPGPAEASPAAGMPVPPVLPGVPAPADGPRGSAGPGRPVTPGGNTPPGSGPVDEGPAQDPWPRSDSSDPAAEGPWMAAAGGAVGNGSRADSVPPAVLRSGKGAPAEDERVPVVRPGEDDPAGWDDGAEWLTGHSGVRGGER